MIELVIRNHLEKILKVPVYLEKEDNMPDSYVIFEKTSGGQKNQINSASFAFQSYAKSMYEAAMLNEELKAAVLKLQWSKEVGGVRLNSDYNFTDVTTKKYRYQAVFDITY
ncbi:MAG: hypothetical protein E6084_00795 [Peptoniphilus harei]|nr:hypothetical protein [Peptoniphilus harei]